MKTLPLSILPLVLLSALSCSSTPSEGESPLSPEENRMEEGFLPTPYSAEEIRAKCEPGRTMVYRVEVKFQPVTYRVFHFTHDELGASIIQTWQEDADRQVIGEITTEAPDWEELQGHASYSEARATVEIAERKTPFGNFDCWLYNVRGEGDEDPQRLYFAQDLPGPPLLVEIESATAGVVLRMEMIDNLEL